MKRDDSGSLMAFDLDFTLISLRPQLSSRAGAFSFFILYHFLFQKIEKELKKLKARSRRKLRLRKALKELATEKLWGGGDCDDDKQTTENKV